MTTNKKIIIFEHSTLSSCNKDSCRGCYDINTCYKASKCYLDEIINLCNDKNFNFALNCTNSTVKAGKYTGYFELNDGTTVEILPKIYKDNKNCYSESCLNNSRKVFQNLLLASSNITKEIKEGTLTSTIGGDSVLLEIFISIFCLEMNNLIDKGLKKFYQTQEDNLNYLKGKIKFPEHIKRNIVSKEKFFVEYDDFIEDIAENKILKSACKYLLSQTKNPENKKILRRCLTELADVSECYNLEDDLSKIQSNRFFKYYENPLKFAEFFLRKKNFIPKSGKSKLPALFFPLNKMFEEFIEYLLKEFKKEFNYNYAAQSAKYHLISKEKDKNADIFLIKPDFIIEKEDKSLILDAKYKIINLKNDLEKLNEDIEEENYYNTTGISQSDLYQVFSYCEILSYSKNKENKTCSALLYPKGESFTKEEDYFYFNKTKISFIPVDLTAEKSQWLDKNDILKNYLRNNL